MHFRILYKINHEINYIEGSRYKYTLKRILRRKFSLKLRIIINLSCVLKIIHGGNPHKIIPHERFSHKNHFSKRYQAIRSHICWIIHSVFFRICDKAIPYKSLKWLKTGKNRCSTLTQIKFDSFLWQSSQTLMLFTIAMLLMSVNINQSSFTVFSTI